MTEQVGEELELDGEQVTSESDDAFDSQNDGISADNTDVERKNTSNWKKLSETKKQLERELRGKDEELSVYKAELQKVQEWANSLYEDPEKRPFVKKEEKPQEDDKFARLEEKLFLSENKEAKEHLDDIHAAVKKYGMDFETAWTFVKSTIPQESRTKKDFDVGSKEPKLPKDLTKVSPEDALNLPKEVRAQWRKANGWE